MQKDKTRSNLPCVLVGSTDSDTLEMLQLLLLGNLPVETFPCQDPSELAKTIADHNPSMVVLDIAPRHLPICLDLIKTFKASGSSVPIIAVTSASDACKLTVQDAGADECVEKPFDVDTFLEVVRRRLGRGAGGER